MSKLGAPVMEENNNGPKETTIKASNLKINEEENEAGSSWLIGNIVEKGISDNSQPPSSFPQPTVLPFPVARHRSHGPHWAPAGSLALDNDGNGEVGCGDCEDESFTGFKSMSAFAKPMHRKQNKGLDVSRWKKINRNDTCSLDTEEDDRLSAEFNKQKKYGESNDTRHTDTKFVNNNLSQYRPKENVRNSLNSQVDEIAKAHMEIMDEMDKVLPEMLKIREQQTSKSTTASCSGFNDSGVKQGSMSIESEIDAENRARLQEMSHDEIEQAQAEIMEKMNPALLEVLKRRALDKLKKQNKLVLGVPATGNHLDHAKVSTTLESDISPMTPYESSKDTQRRLENDSMQKSGQASSSLWNAWSERVEAVRHLRFSLDGVVVEYDIILAHVTGESVTRSDYSADNVAQRDLLRTEGDPGAAGYTIKEAIALTRSVIPGQRALALHLLASLLDKALHHIDQIQSGHTMSSFSSVDKTIDWEAIWAFALGPEPELVLSLRLCLDDNHSSVVLACVKVIQCILSCDINDNFFDILEKTATYEKNVYTAPVFRSRPQIDTGFLHGGLWKYNAKTSNIVLDVVDEKAEEERTIQDDIVLGGQDIAAGLIRMEILPRLCYLLEADPALNLEESIVSILIAIARHSPTCANAIIKCQRLVQTVVHRFTTIDATKVHSAKIKSVTLLKVLAQSDKKNCMELIENGIFQSMMWHLYKPALSISQWIKSGGDHCKVASALMVEQLRLWKVCIKYGYCVSYFADFFPALCLWLNPPTFQKLSENNVFREFTSISMEAYLVLEALARTLPSIYSQTNVSNEEGLDITGDEIKVWTWSHVTPMIDIALKWIALKSNPETIQFFDFKEPTKEKTYLLWVISSVMLMLSSVLERVTLEDKISSNGEHGVVPWLPEFVPKIGLGIIKNGFLSFSEPVVGENSFVENLCNLRRQGEYETSLASVCVLHGLVHVVVSIDNLIYAAKLGPHGHSSHDDSRKGNILEDGILRKSQVEFKRLLTTMMDLVALEWKHVQSIETFGRGGPAPGSGHGWGVFGGGFWSETVLLSQMDSRLLIHLLKIFEIVPNKNASEIEEMAFTIQKIQSALGVCLIVGPRDRVTLEKALDILFQVPNLKFLYFCVCHFMNINEKFRKFLWDYREEDYLCFSEILTSHFRNRWLCVKKKKVVGSLKLNKGTTKLDTIPEEIDTSSINGQDCPSSSLSVEWAHQRLPVPMHWFLSPISNIYDISQSNLKKKSEKSIVVADPTLCLEVTKAGLFFLLGIEAIYFFLCKDVQSPVTEVPIIWKLHSLSVVLLNGMSVLEDEKSRDIYETLQDLYGELLIENKKDENLVSEKKHGLEKLRFQSEIHESYSTFIETLVEQFSAISYGDLIYGRQVAIYLLRGVESPIRLAAWNALSSTRVLELLPPLDKCLANAEGYLEPAEDNEEILEAYVKSWVSGALDRAATRGSVAFTLVLHHISSFIFQNHTDDKLLTRNKLVKSLLRDYSRKPIHEGMMLDLIRYKRSISENTAQNKVSPLDRSVIESRLQSLIEGCEGNSTFLNQVEKLKSLI